MKGLEFFKSIRVRLIFFYIIVVIIPLVLCGLYVYRQVSDVIKKDTSNLIINNLNNVADNIDSMLINAEKVQNYVIANENFIDNIEALKPISQMNSIEDYNRQKIILDLLFDYSFSTPYISSIYVYCEKPDILFRSIGEEKMIDGLNIEEDEWYQNYIRAKNPKSRSGFACFSSPTLHVPVASIAVFSVVNRVTDCSYLVPAAPFWKYPF